MRMRISPSVDADVLQTQTTNQRQRERQQAVPKKQLTRPRLPNPKAKTPPLLRRAREEADQRRKANRRRSKTRISPNEEPALGLSTSRIITKKEPKLSRRERPLRLPHTWPPSGRMNLML